MGCRISGSFREKKKVNDGGLDTDKHIVSSLSGPDSSTTGSNTKGTADFSSPDERSKDLPTINVLKMDSDRTLNASTFVQQSKGMLTGKYARVKKLGAGAYGEVLLCKEKSTGAERAVKIIKKSNFEPASRTALLEEVKVVKKLDHPNIMKLYEFFDDKRNYYLVSDVYYGGELFDEIIDRHKFSEKDAAEVMRQVLSGVNYLHSHGVVHRDLKPENLLLATKEPHSLIKIVDFGLAAHLKKGEELSDRLGTAYYIAPEVLNKHYDEKCDIWASGVITYILLCGYPPFGGETDDEILRKVVKGKYAFDQTGWHGVSSEAKDLIKKMLTFLPANRISAEETLMHPWMTTKCNNELAHNLLGSALGNMRRFRATQRLAQAACLYIGVQLVTQDEKKELTKIFQQLDQNGDGILDRAELIEGYCHLQQARGMASNIDVSKEDIESEVDHILELTDFDKNGTIEYSEFVTACLDKEALFSHERCKAAWGLFDTSATGCLDVHELRKVFHVTDEQWSSILAEVDQNGDGMVDFDEFMTMMKKM